MSDEESGQPAVPGSPASEDQDVPTEHIPPVPMPGSAMPPGSRRLRGVLTSRAAGWVAATALAGAVVALSITTATMRSAPIAGPGRFIVAGRPGNVQVYVSPGGRQVVGIPAGPLVRRVLPFGVGSRVLGGEVTTLFGRVVVGTVGSASSASFTIRTGADQSVTVEEQSSTAYLKAGSPASASVVTPGARVAVLGSLSGSKLSATAVAVTPITRPG
jgi:hypothetical protein